MKHWILLCALLSAVPAFMPEAPETQPYVQFELQGDLRDFDGNIFGASDPWMAYEDGTFYLYYTWGPPTTIYRRTSRRPQGPWSAPLQVLKPEPGHAFETFTAVHEQDGSWVGLVHAYRRMPRQNRLVEVRADSIGGRWRVVGEALAPNKTWERGNFSEPSLLSMGENLLGIYSGYSSWPTGGRRWVMGALARIDGEWRKHYAPVLEPPGDERRRGTINSASHGALLRTPNGGFLAFVSWSGTVAPDSKGILQFYSEDFLNWQQDPSGFTVRSNPHHAGGPAPVVADGRVVLVYHVDNGEGRFRTLRWALGDF